jgi:hypothetical protein
VLAGTLLLGITFPSLAAEAAEAEPAEQTGTADEAAEEPAEADRSSEVFIPSEEISEDFAVSFPVDI